MLTEDEVRKKHSKRLKKELKRKAEDDDVKVEKEISVRDLVRRLSEYMIILLYIYLRILSIYSMSFYL